MIASSEISAFNLQMYAILRSLAIKKSEVRLDLRQLIYEFLILQITQLMVYHQVPVRNQRKRGYGCS